MTDIDAIFAQNKIYFKNANQQLQGAFLLSNEGLMVQQSDGNGGLLSPFLIGQSNVNPNDYYLKTTTLNNITLANADLNLNNYKIINLINPTSNQDAATKYYVDQNVGISQSTADSRYYLNTTTLNNITLSNNNLNLNSYKITNLSDATQATDALNRQSADSRYYLNTTTLNDITLASNNLNLNNNRIINLSDAIQATDALNRQSGDSRYYLNTTPLNNITLATNNLNMNTNRIINVVDPVLNQDAATKHYVDSIVPSSALSILKVLMINQQTTNISIGDHVKYETVEFQRGTNITLDVSAYPNLGRFTLLSGSYILNADVSIHSNNSSSDFTLQVWNVTDNTIVTQGQLHKLPISSTEKFSPLSPLNAVFTLNATKVLELRIVNVSGAGIEYISGLIDQQPAFCIIQQI